MRFYPSLLLWLWLSVAVPGLLNAQDGPVVQLKNGSLQPGKLTQQQLDEFNGKSLAVSGQKFGILQLESIPTPAERKKLEQNGIQLLDYIPANAYTVSITKQISLAQLSGLRVKAILPVSASSKTDAALLNDGADKKEREVLLVFYRSLSAEEVMTDLAAEGFTVTNDAAKAYQLLRVKLPAGKLSLLASLPFVAAIGNLPPEPQKLNMESRNDSRVNVLQSGLPGGYNLTGKGVVVGIAEAASGYPDPHIDYVDRLSRGFTGRPGDYHATHVFGIVGAAGNVNEKYKGYAPEVRIIGTNSSFYGLQLPSLAFDSLMIAANNSYATDGTCMMYNSVSNYLYERIALDFPKLLNVYAAGNSGGNTCNDYPLGFNTMVSGGNSAKNMLSVGNLQHSGEIAVSSSRGPGYGGRIKPDLAAPGTQIFSTISPDRYGLSSGTSMAAPAVTGGIAVLNQRYRQLHSGQIPDASVMKAVLCNTARDLGNKGPDYTYGFGAMNLLRAVRCLDNNWQLQDIISQQQVKTYTIQVPAGTAQLKVMLYWQDPANGLISSRPLVHDLDLKILSPGGITELPYILDTTHSNVANTAIKGADHINNVEQVMIDQPIAGTYTITVSGTEIAQEAAQAFVLVYDILEDKVELSFPYGGESLLVSEANTIQWDDWTGNTSSYTIEFSPDNGNSWQLISAAVPATARQYPWTTSATAAAEALIRIRRNNSPVNSVSYPFVIAGMPVVKLAAVQCRGYMQVEWVAVPDATDYEIFMLRSGRMVPVTTTAATSYSFRGLSVDSVYWVAVRARINGKPGRRSVAISRKPDSGTCSGSISDGDIAIQSIAAPFNSRRFTSLEWGAAEHLKIKVRNLDDQPQSGITVKYRINNEAWNTEIIAIPVAGSAEYTHTFSTDLELNIAERYTIEAVVSNSSDQNPANDTIRQYIRQLENEPIDLSRPYLDSFYQLAPANYTAPFRGLPGADRVDYFTQTDKAKFFTGGLTTSSVRAGLGMSIVNTTATHQVTATYNLSGYNASEKDIQMRAIYSLIRPFVIQSSEKLFIRGDDQSPWIPAFDFGAGTNYYNINSPYINISRLLRDAGQQFSSSFQLSFEQQGRNSDFSISQTEWINTTNDVEIVRIDTFRNLITGAANSIPVYVTIYSHAKENLINLPIKYKLNDGTVTTEIIPLLIPGDTLHYRFLKDVDLSAYQRHRLEVWIESPGDARPANNSKSAITVHQMEFSNSFPYLEDFENGNGNWYSDGNLNSWQYGVPASTVIQEAASGSKAWKTNLTGSYNRNEFSYIVSPFFDISGMTRPMLSFSLALDYDFCFSSYCDVFSFVYSTDGLLWRAMPPGSLSYNWMAGWNGLQGPRWRVRTAELPKVPRIIFRLMLRTNNYLEMDGVGIDDFHLYDSIGNIYKGPALNKPVEKQISGDEWIHFKETDQVLVSINSHGQDLGLVKANAFAETRQGASFHGQYYLNRNFAITAEKQPLAPVSIRLYFRDTEADSLLTSSGCAGCLASPQPYRLGVSAYHSAKPAEYNNSIQDNLSGVWEFFDRSRARIVPFADGYYAEISTTDLSEFWLNEGGLDMQSPLPVRIRDFVVSKISGSETQLRWTTASEINIDHFEIEVAKGNQAFDQGDFSRIAELVSTGRSASPQQYTFTDGSAGKSGVWYYRLKAVDQYGHFSYSSALPVVWSDELEWHVYPNPSATGQFNLQFQTRPGEHIQVQVYNASGMLIRQQEIQGNGFVQRALVDIGKASAAGLYLIKLHTTERQFSLKVVKQ